MDRPSPPGTKPQPTRRNTKHKRVAYGQELIAKATEHRARRAAAKAKKVEAK